MRGYWILAAAALAGAQDLPRGQVIPEVQCAADASQSYALYVPSNYRRDRTWSLILAFDPGARGRVPVERFQEAAERYGYLVAGSNHSRNGSWNASVAAADAMTQDVFSRFAIDPKRVYAAGFSGGARVAMALGSGRMAGVIAASAGFPDAQPRESVPFAVFGTAGADDFNYSEMREVDRRLTSPHRTVIFEGGHGWPPAGLAARRWIGWSCKPCGRAYFLAMRRCWIESSPPARPVSPRLRAAWRSLANSLPWWPIFKGSVT